MRSVLRFLFEADYPPWPMQVVWKVSALGLSGLLTYAAWYGTPGINVVGIVVLQTLGVVFFFGGLFTKLGDN